MHTHSPHVDDQRSIGKDGGGIERFLQCFPRVDSAIVFLGIIIGVATVPLSTLVIVKGHRGDRARDRMECFERNLLTKPNGLRSVILHDFMTNIIPFYAQGGGREGRKRSTR